MLLCDFGQDLELIRREIFLAVLLVNGDKVDQALAWSPEVDDPQPAPLADVLKTSAELAQASAVRDDIAGIRVVDHSVLENAVMFIGKDFRDEPHKQLCFDDLHNHTIRQWRIEVNTALRARANPTLIPPSPAEPRGRLAHARGSAHPAVG